MLRSTFNEITLVAKTSKVLYATVDRPERKLNLGGGFLTDKWEQIRHPGEHPSQAVWWWHGLSQHQLEQNAGNCWAFRSFLPQTLPGEGFPVTLALSPLLEVAARDFSFKDRFVVIVLLLLFFSFYLLLCCWWFHLKCVYCIVFLICNVVIMTKLVTSEDLSVFHHSLCSSCIFSHVQSFQRLKNWWSQLHLFSLHYHTITVVFFSFLLFLFLKTIEREYNKK